MKKETDSSRKIQPLADRVLVKREETVEKSPAGIIIPDTASKEKSKTGTVLAIGPGKMSKEGKLIPVQVKVGSKVIFNAGWDNEVGHKDENLFLVEESAILAVIK
ncbi:MAG: hypothetical protein RLZZ416_212 [Candidatus Parcubacteria bacterium]|jgi:chaperonin GroES